MSVGRDTRGWLTGTLAAFAAAVVVAAVYTGTKPLAWGTLLQSPSASIDAQIFWRVRLPRVCLGFLAGAALAASGMAFQALFRNALATPFTLGVSSGASLGAALYVKSGLAISVAGLSGSSAAAFLGALGTIALVYGLTRAGSGFSTSTLLLAGVAVSYVCASLILAIQYTGDLTTSFRVGRWLMGGLEVVGFGAVWEILPLVTAGLAVVFALRHELDLLAMGEDIAAARGVSVGSVKRVLFLAASLMVGGVVAACGPIAFVGLIVPHMGRLLIGPAHRHLAPFSLLVGGGFLVLCDAVARTVMAPLEIPVGIITALLGGPFFLGLLVRGYSEHRGLEGG